MGKQMILLTGKRIMLVMLTLGSVRLMPDSGRAAPHNDRFADRQALAGGTVHVTASNAGATVEAGEPLGQEVPGVRPSGGSTVWWTWQAPGTGPFTVSLVDSEFDTLLGVYRGEVVGELSVIAENDDADVRRGVTTSEVSIYAAKGRAYHIAVAGFLNPQDQTIETGTVQLKIHPSKPNPAPGWEALDFDGETVTSAAYAGKVVLLDFWATWCGTCLRQIPELVRLQEAYGKAGFVVVGVVIDPENTVKLRSLAKRFGINYPLIKATPEMEKAFGGIRAVPTTFLIDARNNEFRKHEGLHNQKAMERDILSLLEGVPGNGVVAGAVLLRVERGPAGAVVRWPAGNPGYRLESAGQLVTGPWGPATETILPGDDFNQAKLAPGTESRFYRLKKP